MAKSQSILDLLSSILGLLFPIFCSLRSLLQSRVATDIIPREGEF